MASTYYQLQECVNSNYVESTETEDIPEIVVANEESETPPASESCETRSKTCLITLAICKAFAIILALMVGLATLALILYVSFRYVLIPYSYTVLLLLVMLPYYAATVVSVGWFIKHQNMERQSAHVEDFIPIYCFFLNCVWFGLGEAVAWLWRSDYRELTWDTEDSTFTTYYTKDFGWHYDVFFYSTMATFVVWGIVCFYALAKAIYNKQIGL